MSKSTDVLKTLELCIVDGIEYAFRLSSKYNSCIKENPEGIYLNNSPTPIMVSSQKYYTKDGTVINEIKTNITDIKEDIYDINMELVVPRQVIRNASKYLTTSSKINLHALQIVHLFISDYIEHKSPYINNVLEENKYLSHLTDEGKSIFKTTKILDTLFRDLSDMLDSFMCKDIWNIYFIKLNGTDFYIEKNIDFRIYDWTLKNELEEYRLKEEREEGLK